MKIVVLDGYTENPGDLSWAGFEARVLGEKYACAKRFFENKFSKDGYEPGKAFH